MLSGSEPKLDDVQYGILKLGLRFARDQFYHVSLNTLCEHMKCSDSIVEAALALLADREQIKLGQYRGRVGAGEAWCYYKNGMNIAPFLYEGGNFAYKVTPLGRELLDRLSEERGGNNLKSEFPHIPFTARPGKNYQLLPIKLRCKRRNAAKIQCSIAPRCRVRLR